MSMISEPTVDWIGYAGSACVLSAFYMRGMLALRATSIVGNLVFITFSLQAGVMPVLLLNSLLLPLNSLRLIQTLRTRSTHRITPPAPARSPTAR